MEMICTAGPAVARGGRRQNPGSRRRLPVYTAGMPGPVWARADTEADTEGDAEADIETCSFDFGLRGALTADHGQT